MTNGEDVRMAGALAALNWVPPSLRETVARDPLMREGYGIRIDSVLKVGDSDLEAPVSTIAKGVRDALDGGSTTIHDNGGGLWSIESDPDSDQPTLVLVQGKREIAMHAWLALSPDRAVRLRCLDALAADAGLPPHAGASWAQVLQERSLDSEEVPAFVEDLHDTPHVQEQFLANSFNGPGLNSQLAAPSSRRYFERLVGPRGDSASIEEHAATGGRERLAELAIWKPYEGFLKSLYMAAHPDLSAQVRVDGLSTEELVRAFEFVLRAGDRVSQLGAIEVGLRVSADRPEVNPVLNELVELIRSDDTTGKTSGFRGYSLLYILVSSELSTRQQLAGEPCFYRRLAALAQAGVIQRQMVAAGITFRDSAIDSVVGEYFLRSLVDLRLEPRRYPVLGSAHQLRNHYFGRIARAADRYENEVDPGLIRALGHVMGPEQLREAGDKYVLHAPGPLEEPEERREMPAEFSQAIQAQLDTEKAVTTADFAALRTSATSFSIGEAQADLAASALERSGYRLADVHRGSELLNTVASLAVVAAIARSERLADALRVVLRTSPRDAESSIALVDAVQVLAVAAASRAKLSDWANFLGDCLTELAFGDLAEDEGEILHGYVRRLCEMVPELWATCGTADAALAAYNGSLARGRGSSTTTDQPGERHDGHAEPPSSR